MVSISTALCLPAPDIEALVQGRTIAALPKMFIRTGQQFALYPTDSLNIPLSVEQYYRLSFLPIASSAIANLNSQGILLQPKQISLLPDKEQLQLPLLTSETVSIQAWAKCELCQIINNAESLTTLSSLTIWTQEALQEVLAQRQNIFLAYLRIYQLPKAVDVSVTRNSQFVALPQPLTVLEANPLLSDRIFAQRKHQLETLQPPPHPELEELQSALASLAITNSAAKQLEEDIKVFLGWSHKSLILKVDPDLAWINEIGELGDRSIELEDKKSNYQAGTDFENITRRSLEFLGFKVEEAYKGGAGGLDLFCSQPYPLVCECKAGKLIPSRTVEELLKLGGMHLGKVQFLNSAKLVIGPGHPSSDTLKASKEWEVSIINAMTLQKLVKLKAQYPGAINLFELKEYLESGQIDYRLDEYIQKTEKEIALRAYLVQLVKNYLESTGLEKAGVDALHGAYFGSKPPQPLKIEEMHEILIELSSPLTGYLGRIKGSDWKSDRFYFLRDLLITNIS
ncbi:hypothetical protein PCC6912_33250 [Chlorogloeopsis fritschii PCC 6912]|uniref:DUF1802 domain-containing protein n=2 Tax=Chlorogloeopsis fritschii TaxID=1124 RepID=A0A3S0ZMB0_CHLFR|nr:DUF1802 family protein [Chlorogloeopsis fritschii]RUR79151.1 hypothetical protein PCC6912_33250 [Chlorogloeopsis fritschii PCC 6912]